MVADVNGGPCGRAGPTSPAQLGAAAGTVIVTRATACGGPDLAFSVTQGRIGPSTGSERPRAKSALFGGRGFRSTCGPFGLTLGAAGLLAFCDPLLLDAGLALFFGLGCFVYHDGFSLCVGLS